MATIEQVQEIANRGIQDQLSPGRRLKFDELVNRGLVTLPDAVPDPLEQPEGDTQKGFMERFGEDIAERRRQTVDIFEAAGEQSSIETVIQLAGKTFAGTALDFVGEGLITAFRALPDVVENPIRDQAAALLQSDIGQLGIAKLGQGEEKYKEWAAENPREARDIESLVNIGSLFAPAKIGKGLGITSPGVGDVVQAATGAAKAAGEVGLETAKGIFKFQSPTKQRIASLIEEGSTDVETARFKLAEPEPAPPGAGQPPRTKIQEALDIGGPRVATDRAARDAIKQGFDEGVIAAVKGSSKVDKSKMLEMVGIMEKGKKNKRFAQLNRPGDVAGDSLMERFKVVTNANRTAGKELDVVAKELKGQKVDHSPAINSFVDDLDSMGVTLTDDLKPKFKGSDIEDVTPSERVITQVVNRVKSIDGTDAHDLHRLKRFIDEQVTFGKRAEGLGGKTEIILKNLRRNLDGILDTNFPEYDRVNTVYSETIGAIDALQDVAGKKMNLLGPNAAKATGTLLRRLMSNEKSRVTLLDAVKQLEEVAKKQGGKFDDDILSQVLFVDELDAVFGPVARTSFQGQIGQAIKGAGGIVQDTLFGTGVKAVGAVAEKVRGINEAGAFKAIKEVLKEQ